MSRSVAVVGLGRVGLPLALLFARGGFRVHGIEISQERVDLLQRKQMPFMEEGLQELLTQYAGTRFHPMTDPAGIRDVEAVVITLGTPVDEHMNPILSQIESVVRAMAPHFSPGQLVVLRSTVAPGTTESIGRLIERHTPHIIGQSLFLAFCPERIAEGRALEEIPEVPQIVGGMDAESTRRATVLFESITRVTLSTDARSAELAKLFCNMYRYIDFAIANEFMMIAQQHERNVYEVLRVANHGYKRGGIKQPGLTGGPCLYKDGFFLVDHMPFNELISCAWKINETVPAYLIDQIKRLKRLEGSKVALLGLGFKKNIDDIRNSLSFKAKKIFRSEGAEVALHDPYVPSPPLEEVVAGADVIFLAMNHDAYRDLGLDTLTALAKDDAVICDVWNIFGTGDIVFRLGRASARLA